MLTLAVFGNIRAAKAVSDYLHQNNIENQIIHKEDGFHLLCEQDSDLDNARILLDDFVKNPNDDKFWAASWDRGQVDDLSANQPPSTGILRTVWQNTGYLTRVLGLFVLFIFILQVLGYSGALYQHLGFPAQLHNLNWHEIYRLITPAFMHGDLTHLVLNLFWWVWLAGQLEKIKGASWLFNATLITGLTAHLCQYLMVSSSFIGLSGVVYGLLGYAWLAGKFGRLNGLNLPSGIIVMMLLWLAVGFSEILNLRMANWAHLGGLLAGLAMAIVEAKWLKK
ncbi:rhomboid family intramembrane serine protease [Catenovulum sp. 2E275]|uniref:rhomboid family intramembrane serine protease n=1 Tax=Catenovulum sp. 2E275 TaxID=2980497 RepID=UPI0021D37342|nr:rhomboid family intramembrane serine protease [Catenovulum sp. 2E275]MCU4674358.1 rhomboid family intramembrane serine protease [Catenovulum sp. 2E275]